MAGKRFDVFGIQEGEDKSFWTKIGSAWENRDGSFNVVLNYLPLTGKLNIREPKEKEA